ncbi:DAK2 domain-containing protein [Corynebacterium aquilae]|uniref:DhaL domain-containing protein n=1 Tax=Corynebacterium aquilae DSM 44791 TaxID=1431546 RepID=A0A1L7CFQ0_9CORY|nr:DAK2 domain-containing protein [Corynebacterium aquilae]APT84644.1 hypothetical protein CAQU_05695 [Corynebacterium aquilae DSM 44791]
MPHARELNGHQTLAWAHRAVNALEARRAEINALNVFPVPDSDTGSNMAYTMRSAIDIAEKLPTTQRHSASNITHALAAGSVRGARGNSGVVLSQVLRGLAQETGSGNVTATAVAQALTSACQMVDKAISQPVEGTVITVLRAGAIAAQHAVEQHPATSDTQLRDVVAAACDAARTALALTPSQLPALREAGVVDAGGQGFVFLLEALLDEIEGRDESVLHAMVRPADDATLDAAATSGTQTATNHPPRQQPDSCENHQTTHTDTDERRLEVMCFAQGVDIEHVRAQLNAYGDSIIVAPAADDACTVHIHVDAQQAGPLIEALYTCATISDLRLEILPPVPVVHGPKRIIVAVVPEGPLADLFRAAQATTISPGDSLVNDIASAVKRQGSQEVILLPNGLATRQQLISTELAAHASNRPLAIVNTDHLVAGLAALAVHDANQPLAVDNLAMTEAATSVRTALINQVEHGHLTPAGAVAAGDWVATAGNETFAVGESVLDCTAAAARTLLRKDGEMLTVLVQSTVSDVITVDNLEAILGEDIDIAIYLADGIDATVELGVE